ncbi:hypothetical protein RDABS01_028269 [Bienertia sinuspersici]
MISQKMQRNTGQQRKHHLMGQQQQINMEQQQQNVEVSTEHEATSPRGVGQVGGKYDLPKKVVGVDVTEALSFQCSMLYKHWRFRLKEQHFRNKSVADAINSRPNTIDVDKWTWLVCEYWNGEMQKINAPTTQPTQELDGSSKPHETQQEPLYITLFEKTKKYEALKMLHEKEVEKHGEDTLSVKDAYTEVFKQKSGYVKGFGPEARPPKKCGAGDAAAREASLASEIETLKASNDELKTSNEELIPSNDELKATVSRINIKAIKREKKLIDDMMKTFEQMRYVTFRSSFYSY